MGLIFSQPVVAWVHLLAYWFQDNQEEFYMNNNLKPEVWIMWENKWHTIRYGMQADIISYETFKNHKLSDHIYYWIDKLDSYVQLLGYQAHIQTIKDIIEKGCSSERLRKIYVETQDITEVVKHNVNEFEYGAPIWN